MEAGADIVAVDCTLRQGRTPEAIQALLEEYKAGLGCADHGGNQHAEEGRIAAAGGAGYFINDHRRIYALFTHLEEPDYRLIEELIETTPLPINAEGRFYQPEQVVRALKLGAWTVTVGSAITRPHCITRTFTQAIDRFKTQEKGAE